MYLQSALFRLVSEAERLRRMCLLDPLLAIRTSLVEPHPLQVIALHEMLLRKRSLRYLLVDEEVGGNVIMAGLIAKALLLRGELGHCLIVAPIADVQRWQEDLVQRFQIAMEILGEEYPLTKECFAQIPGCIVPFEILADECLQELLEQIPWDLVIFDGTQILSGACRGEAGRIPRANQLAQMLGRASRHVLLLTATLTNDAGTVQQVMAALDVDRFEWRFREMEGMSVQQVCEGGAGEGTDSAHPQVVKSFFLAAFQQLGGEVYEREPGRYEITSVPEELRRWQSDRHAGIAILRQYERIVFEKRLMYVPGLCPATLLCPSHPLLEAMIELVQQRWALLWQECCIQEKMFIETYSLKTVMTIERRLGCIPRDVRCERRGYDVESSVPQTGTQRLIVVKGCPKGAQTITLARNEVLIALNQPETFLLAIVIIDGEGVVPYYITQPFERDVDCSVTSVTCSIVHLLNRGGTPLWPTGWS